LKADVGDCCYFLLRNQSKIKLGTIVKVHAGESAVEVMESVDSKFHFVWENNAAWEESELKGKKWVKPHNYIRNIPKEISDEKKLIKRSGAIHNRKQAKSKVARKKRKS
jgi:hypothetical protein